MARIIILNRCGDRCPYFVDIEEMYGGPRCNHPDQHFPDGKVIPGEAAMKYCPLTDFQELQPRISAEEIIGIIQDAIDIGKLRLRRTGGPEVIDLKAAPSARP
jgi:hypothetical protein